ncbi:MAG: cupin domain-containing protein [Pseudomonadota bacterium]
MSALIHGPGAGAPNRAFGFERWLRIPSASGFALFEEHVPAGKGPPLHIHLAESELFTVLEGRVLFHCDGEEAEARPGTTVLIPPGDRHAFRAVEAARLLIQLTPAEGYGFFEEVEAAGLTPPDDMPRIAEIGAKYHLDFVGPPI